MISLKSGNQYLKFEMKRDELGGQVATAPKPLLINLQKVPGLIPSSSLLLCILL